MPRFFVAADQIPIISGSDAHQIKNVLRLKVGQSLELLDGSGKVYLADILEFKSNQVVTKIIKVHQLAAEQTVKVTIAQCLPKHKKMDLIIQKCTELGAAKIVPTLSERAIAKGEKLERWRKIAKEAAEQCGRTIIPEISELSSFNDVLKLKTNYDLALIPWEVERNTSLKQILTNQPTNQLLILIGPEGGFSQTEVNQAKDAGFTPISLGQRILRTETAGLAILAMINYHFDQ